MAHALPYIHCMFQQKVPDQPPQMTAQSYEAFMVTMASELPIRSCSKDPRVIGNHPKGNNRSISKNSYRGPIGHPGPRLLTTTGLDLVVWLTWPSTLSSSRYYAAPKLLCAAFSYKADNMSVMA